jgi:hypothetical protein
MSKGIAAAWSCLGTLALLAGVAFCTGGFEIVLKEFPEFLFGGVATIRETPAPFYLLIPVIFAVVVIDFPCALLAGYLQSILLEDHGRHAVAEKIDELKEGHLFTGFFFSVLFEELLARWFFLGVLTMIPLFSSTFGFYLLFILGNGIWALMHLSNFEDERDRHWLRVLPQFVSGVFFTYVYVKFGLLGAVLTHFAANAVLFCLHKVQDCDFADVLVIVVSGMLAAGSYYLMERPLGDVTAWLSDYPVFTLSGWGFWDYVKFSVFASAVLTLVFELLCYDRTAIDTESKESPGLISIFAMIVFTVLVMYLLFAFFGIFVSSVPHRIVVISILLAFGIRSESGSAMARTFWVSLPGIFITICILQGLPFWQGILFILLESVLLLPLTLLRKFQR